MRMRKKKHLEERLSAVSDILFISDIEDRNFNTAVKAAEYIDFNAWFKDVYKRQKLINSEV